MKRKIKNAVPRSTLREKLDGMMKSDAKDPWDRETGYGKQKHLLERYPFSALGEMHQQLFPKVLACLTTIVVALLLNIINIPAVNSLADGMYGLTAWNMEITTVLGGAVDVVNSFRGAPPERRDETPGGEEGFSLPATNASVLSSYGFREHPVRGNEMHYGVDFKASSGSPVAAALEGTVLKVEEDPQFGLTVTLDHGNGLKTFYGRLEQLKVAVGDGVAAGEAFAVIAGREDGESFLHFEIWINDRPVNPETLLFVE